MVVGALLAPPDPPSPPPANAMTTSASSAIAASEAATGNDGARRMLSNLASSFSIRSGRLAVLSPRGLGRKHFRRARVVFASERRPLLECSERVACRPWTESRVLGGQLADKGLQSR